HTNKTRPNNKLSHGVDGTAADACLAGFATSACSHDGPFVATPACNGVLVGLAAAGGDCLLDTGMDCAQGGGGAFCDMGTTQTCPGKCTPKFQSEFVDAGEDDVGQCGAGLFWYDISTDSVNNDVHGTCLKDVDAGASCAAPTQYVNAFDSLQCAPGSFCDTNDTCSPLLASGAACNDDFECQPQFFCEDTCGGLPAAAADCGNGNVYCQLDLACNFDTFKCVVPGAPGATCSDDHECNSTSFCNDPNFTGGTCETRVDGGVACTGNDLQCQSGYSCNNDTCAPIGGVGAPCGFETDCQFPLDCDSTNHCAPRAACP
ncbi:MAG: hypothetical protein ACJ790_15240, partial [Myxococcaceae bacterium]